MSEPYPEPQAIPEAVGGRLALVIALELTLLLGGTYGAWRIASNRGLGVRARPSPSRDDNVFAGGVFVPNPPAPPAEQPATVAVTFHTRAKFGIERVVPHDDNPQPLGRLTSSTRGITNRTTLRIDGVTRELGTGPGAWVDNPQRPDLPAIPGRCWVHAWEYPNKVRVTQAVMRLADAETNRTETVLVRYLIENQGEEEAHSIALRFLLDTHVGDADGVPFAVPGWRGLLKEPREFKADRVPCFIQALERANLSDPGTAATLTLRAADPLGSGRAMLEPPGRLLLTGYPEGDEWEIDKSEFHNGDSCVVLYWAEERLRPGKQRVLGFLYGQGTLIADQGNAELAASYGPKPFLGMEFDVIAWVKDPAVGQVASIRVPPDAMRLADPKTATLPVRVGHGSLVPIAWRVKVDRDAMPGDYPVTVSSGGARLILNIPVRAFDFEVME